MASSSSTVFPKKRRNQPGNPDPDAEVIALSPRTLMETNRFLCEVCQKGFKREQNLHLHRRGHNLPWKLKQKATNVAHRKVYLCPEPTCVHHDPSRALGDLTGIKKHFLRKHGEKKYNCDNCSKKYAVLSDWKAHSKTCGTREYRCDCGTLFSGRDRFITHRTFCNTQVQETARNPVSMGGAGSILMSSVSSGSMVSHPYICSPNTPFLLGLGQSAFRPSHPTLSPYHPSMPMVPSSSTFFLPETLKASPMHAHDLLQNNSGVGGSSFAAQGLYNLSYFSKRTNSGGESGSVDNSSTMLFQSHFNNGSNNGFSNSSLFSAIPSLFTPSPLHQVEEASHMSATALLQKAAQMGSTSSNTRSTLLRTFSGEHHHQFGGGMYDLVASITSPPGNYSSYVGAANLNFGGHESPLKLSKSSSNEHGRIFGGQEGLNRDFLGIHPAGSGGGETSEDRKPPPLSFKGPTFGIGGVCFK